MISSPIRSPMCLKHTAVPLKFKRVVDAKVDPVVFQVCIRDRTAMLTAGRCIIQFLYSLALGSFSSGRMINSDSLITVRPRRTISSQNDTVQDSSVRHVGCPPLSYRSLPSIILECPWQWVYGETYILFSAHRPLIHPSSSQIDTSNRAGITSESIMSHLVILHPSHRRYHHMMYDSPSQSSSVSSGELQLDSRMNHLQK